MQNWNPMRAIVTRHRYQTASHPHGTWSVELTLECGHRVHRKGSAEPRYRCRCHECARLHIRVLGERLFGRQLGAEESR